MKNKDLVQRIRELKHVDILTQVTRYNTDSVEVSGSITRFTEPNGETNPQVLKKVTAQSSGKDVDEAVERVLEKVVELLG